MKRWTLALLALLLCGAGPASLLVGVVHDQNGQPIAGARVSFESQEALTDASGTFALPVVGVSGYAVISCAYCETTQAQVRPGEPIVAIVRRYDAVAHQGPTDRDIQAMRYSSAASDVSLRPFEVLNDTPFPEPGPRVSLYGTSNIWGGLLIDNGVPSYDIAAGNSTFSLFPASDPQRITYADSSDSFRYGDNSGAGTFFVDSQGDPGWSGFAMAGNERGARLSQNRYGFASSADISSTSFDSAGRVNASLTVPIGDDTLTASVIGASSRQSPAFDQSLDSSFNAGKISYLHNAGTTVQADVMFDNSGYDGMLYEGAGVAGAWSDFEADAGVQSGGNVHAFADASLRKSTGLYSDPTIASTVAGAVTQGRIDGGLQFTSSNFSGTAGLGVFTFDYTGGSGGVNQPLSTHLVTPSIDMSYSPAPQVTASLSSAEYFRLPSLLEVYAPPISTELALEQSPVTVAKVSYADLRRVRFELLDVSGGNQGTGADVAWEIAPNLSLRAWTLAFANNSESTSGTANAIWATYENPQGIRLDLNERRDLNQGAENEHLDAALSAPLGPHLRVFAATERPTTTRLYKAGLQIVP